MFLALGLYWKRAKSERLHFRNLNPKPQESGWTGVGRLLNNNAHPPPPNHFMEGGGGCACQIVKTLKPKH